MVCRLCLQNSSEVLDIFNNKGQELKIAMVIGKHFWFEPKIEDTVSSHICNCCWTKLSDFHEFYKHVEKAQQLLTVEVIVKTEYKLTVSDITVEGVGLASKHELEENVEQYERPFNITSEVLAEDNCGVMKFEFPTDLKDESIVINEKKKDDQDIFAVHYRKKDESDLQFPIKDKKNILRKKGTKPKRSCKRNKVVSLNQNATTYKGHALPRKGDAAPLTNKTNWSEEKVSKHRIYNDPSGSNFTTREMSEIVNQKISEYMQLKCDVCGIEFDTFCLIRSHMRSVHDIRPYVKCCEKKFARRATLYDHIKFHLNPDIYKCEKCNKVFSEKHILTNHNISMHEPEDTKIFPCPQCPKKFARKYLLQGHKTRQHNNELKYFCPECKKGFPYMSALTSHTAFGHGTKCNICSKVVKGQVAFKRHQLKHLSILEPIAQCDQSTKRNEVEFLTEETTTTYKCRGLPRIGEVAPLKNNQQSDIKYVCNICKKSYEMAQSLKAHMLQHTGLSLYPCPHCSRTFYYISTMRRHRKQKHPKEFEELRELRNISARSKKPTIPTISSVSDATKNSGEFVRLSCSPLVNNQSNGKYECNICKKSYEWAKSLKEHMSKHTGLSLYRCLHCSQTFNHISNMHIHRRRKHPKEFEELRKLRKVMPTLSSLSNVTKNSGDFVPFSSSALALIREKQEHAKYK